MQRIPKRGLGWLAITAAALAFLAPCACAAWTDDVEVKGFVSSAYTWNLNKTEATDSTNANTYRVFDTRHDSFTLDAVQLSFARNATKAGETGFRADLVAGYGIAPVLAGASEREFAMEQAYVRWVAPVGTGLTLDMGKLLTHLGYELVEGVDGWNDQYSRSLLFGWAIPFTHTGLRAGYAPNSKVAAMLEITNGWDNNIDLSNQGKTLGAQLIVTPASTFSVTGNAVYGSETSDPGSRRWVGEGILSVTPTPGLRIGVDALAGQETRLVAPPTPADSTGALMDGKWMGVAGYLNYDLTPKFLLHLRAEMLDDQDGARTGMVQKLTEITFTPEYKISDNMSVRGEFRMDSSDQEAFAKLEAGGALKAVKTQPTLGLNWVYKF